MSQELQPANAAIDSAIASLTKATPVGLRERQQMAVECIDRVASVARDWVDTACRAKGIPADSYARAEEVLAGPVGLIRYLRLISQTLEEIETTGVPRLTTVPKRLADGRVSVQVISTERVFDPVTFAGLKASVRMQPGVEPAGVHGSLIAQMRNNAEAPSVSLVLGAGNVSAIPATDALSRVLQEGRSVLLKMNPVNEYLTPTFERVFQPLIKADLLRIICGGADVGAAAVSHPQVNDIHITGSHHTHDAIVWGNEGSVREQHKRDKSPLIEVPVTSELGNVTPWIIVPGAYSARQLEAQAEHVAASIVNNASFNCIATKVIVTWKAWPEREKFLELLRGVLARVADRNAYYPGARERFEKFTGEVAPEGETLPWRLVENADPGERSDLFEEESFVCVCAETAIDASSPKTFLTAAVEFVNERLFGSLAATITVPDQLRRQQPEIGEQAIDRLRYGSVCINQWAGLVYGMMAPPWGAYPGATLDDIGSGRGFVHNTDMLEGIEKTVLAGPLRHVSYPVWFPGHRNAEATAWQLMNLYRKPGLMKLVPLMLASLRA